MNRKAPTLRARLKAAVGAARAAIRGDRLAIVGKAPALSGVDETRGWIRLFSTGSEWKPFAWQRDLDLDSDTVLAFHALFACVTLIASDVAKLGLRLTQFYEPGGIWVETSNPAYDGVLRKPNHFQTRQQFVEAWLLSKLIRGNTYALKQRDGRGVVTKLYILHPDRVRPLVAPNGDVFYELRSDDLSKLPFDLPAVPASEIIHDRFNCLFHPLVGISPLYAAALPASQGLNIQQNSAKFFENMSRPGGVLTAPGEIEDATAARLKTYWETEFKGDALGKVAVLGDGLSYQPLTVNADDAQLVEQLKISAEQVCTAFAVPGFMVGVGQMPSFDNVQALTLRYYSQCLQKLIEALEAGLDDGLALDPGKYRTEFDLSDLMRMDEKTLATVEGEKVKNAIVSPDEARRKFNLPPVPGGASPYLQQQNYSLAALAKRDAQDNPFGSASPAPAPAADPPADPEDDPEDEAPPAATAEDVQRAIEATYSKLAGDLPAAIDAALAKARDEQVAREAALRTAAEAAERARVEAVKAFGDALAKRLDALVGA